MIFWFKYRSNYINLDVHRWNSYKKKRVYVLLLLWEAIVYDLRSVWLKYCLRKRLRSRCPDDVYDWEDSLLNLLLFIKKDSNLYDWYDCFAKGKFSNRNSVRRLIIRVVKQSLSSKIIPYSKWKSFNAILYSQSNPGYKIIREKNIFYFFYQFSMIKIDHILFYI